MIVVINGTMTEKMLIQEKKSKIMKHYLIRQDNLIVLKFLIYQIELKTDLGNLMINLLKKNQIQYLVSKKRKLISKKL